MRYPCSVAIENARLGTSSANRSASSAAFLGERRGPRHECAMPTKAAEDSESEEEGDEEEAGVEADASLPDGEP